MDLEHYGLKNNFHYLPIPVDRNIEKLKEKLHEYNIKHKNDFSEFSSNFPRILSLSFGFGFSCAMVPAKKKILCSKNKKKI